MHERASQLTQNGSNLLAYFASNIWRSWKDANLGWSVLPRAEVVGAKMSLVESNTAHNLNSLNKGEPAQNAEDRSIRLSCASSRNRV